MPSSRTSTASCPPIVGRNRTKPCSFSDIRTLFSNNLMCVRRFTVDNRTLFPYNIMCDCQSEVRSMNAKEKIEELLEASEDGTITAAQVTEAGLQRFTGVCQKRRDVPLRARPVCAEQRMGGRFLPLAAQVWARDLLARYRSVSVGLFRPYPGEIYDDLSQGLQCPVLKAGELNHQARCAGEL